MLGALKAGKLGALGMLIAGKLGALKLGKLTLGILMLGILRLGRGGSESLPVVVGSAVLMPVRPGMVLVRVPAVPVQTRPMLQHPPGTQ